MTLLYDIKSELQEIIESLHDVTNVDMAIVDDELYRVAATGVLANTIGEKAPVNSLFHKCLKTAETYFIDDPRVNEFCIECENLYKCSELVEMCLPIKYDNRIIGVIGLCAFDEKTKESFVKNKNRFYNLEIRIRDIIEEILKRRDYAELLEYRYLEFKTLINSINEGIVVADNHLNIQSANDYVIKRFDLNKQSTNILSDILPDKILNKLKDGFCGDLGPVYINGNDYMVQINTFYFSSERKGHVLVFKDFKKMKDSIMKSNRDREFTTFDDIVGESEAIRQARLQAVESAKVDVPVLIYGETGTGKEVFAKAIHFSSNRSKEMYMAINCGAISENLIESELFGYEKGSFTGALSSGKKGIFEVSTNGTLLLDEISELKYSTQVKLLRALEEKEIRRIGSSNVIKANPRIIAATNKNLSLLVEKKEFREDLFYRLNIIQINIPPLRERGYDVLLLARYFLDNFNKAYSKNIKGFTVKAEKLLLDYPFPGNVRELKNIIEYCVIFENGETIDENMILKKISSKRDNFASDKTLKQIVSEYEKEFLKKEMLLIGDSVEEKKNLAKRLDISLATLYRKLED